MQTIRVTRIVGLPAFIFSLSVLLLMAGCQAAGRPALTGALSRPDDAQPEKTSASSCAVTEPALITPPDDPAVQNSPEPGYYFVNEDRSIWASAPDGSEDNPEPWQAGEEGVKVGWFRPAGADLEISGRRLDATAPPFQAHIPCCYPTRFQATGLVFPTPGCWEVTARASNSRLTFTVFIR